MTATDAFMADIQANPNDRTTRLIFADWLEDQGESARADAYRGWHTNTMGMHFVPVKQGTFWMGSPDGEKGRYIDEAQREVAIERDFYLGIHQVTQQQWSQLMGRNPSWFSRTGGGEERVTRFSDEELQRFPVESVSWEDVQDYLSRLNALDSGYLYRLPSEAEWEYACRGGHLSSEGKTTVPFYSCRPMCSISSTQANFDGTFPYGGAAKATV